MRPRKDAMVKRELTVTMPSKVIVWMLVVVVISFVLWVVVGVRLGILATDFFCFVLLLFSVIVEWL